MRRCSRCRRQTPRQALVEAHVPPPNNARRLLGADWVIWLCPGCAAPPFQPTRPNPRERR
jgi:hypothetical protein